MLLNSSVKIASFSSQGLLSDTCFLPPLGMLPVFHVSPHIPPCISICLFLLSSDLLQLLLRCLSTKERFQSRAGSFTVPWRRFEDTYPQPLSKQAVACAFLGMLLQSNLSTINSAHPTLEVPLVSSPCPLCCLCCARGTRKTTGK